MLSPSAAIDMPSCICPTSHHQVVKHLLSQVNCLYPRGALSLSAAGDTLFFWAPADDGSTARGLPHALQAVKYSQLAASRSPVRGTPIKASSAAAQSPSVQVDFSPVMRLLPRVFEALMPAAGSAKALLTSPYIVKSNHMVEPSHLPQSAG